MPIVYKRADGGISVCIPCVAQDDPSHFTTNHAYERAMNKDIPDDATNVIQIDVSLIPEGDVFRDAWNSMNEKGNVTYDMSKVKNIVNSRLTNEMKSYTDQLDLAIRMGRSTTSIENDMADCKDRVAKLDALTIPQESDLNVLATLKALIKE